MGGQPDRPIRVLQVVGSMDCGGAETWLVQVLRIIDRKRFAIDFLVHTDEECFYDSEIRALGSSIWPCLSPHRPWTYARNLRRILRSRGPYDVVHSHVYHFSGFVLRIAEQCGVPVRIAHSRTDTAAADRKKGALRRAYIGLSRSWITRHATDMLAISRPAAEALFGDAWEHDSRVRLLHTGIDFTPFRSDVDRRAVRDEFGIPEGAFVLGHVGRFVAVKNHQFTVCVADELLKRRPDAFLILVGDGPLRGEIERQVAEAGLSERVVFTGVRGDAARIMLGAMDAFVFPSLYEGFGRACVEAQASGLPCVISGAIPKEVDVVKDLVTRLPLDASAETWAGAIEESARRADLPSRAEALRMLEQSPFDITATVRELERVYEQGNR